MKITKAFSVAVNEIGLSACDAWASSQ